MKNFQKAQAYFNKGTAYLDRDLKKAEHYFLQALQLYLVEFPDGVHEDIASLYFSLGYAKEQQYVQKSQKTNQIKRTSKVPIAANKYYDKALTCFQKLYPVTLSRYSYDELHY